jgi:hypothetical protein
MAAHVMHSKYDARETTAKARKTFLDRFEREVVEAARQRGEELTDPTEIARRAGHHPAIQDTVLRALPALKERGLILYESPPPHSGRRAVSRVGLVIQDDTNEQRGNGVI